MRHISQRGEANRESEGGNFEVPRSYVSLVKKEHVKRLLVELEICLSYEIRSMP